MLGGYKAKSAVRTSSPGREFGGWVMRVDVSHFRADSLDLPLAVFTCNRLRDSITHVSLASAVNYLRRWVSRALH